MPDLISIIMPVYNAAPFLRECLDSIKQQSHQNWELIAVDDFSTDASFKILEEASFFDSRIKVYQNTNKGIIPALSLAFSKVQGTYTTRMDTDDLMPPGRLQKMHHTIKYSPPKTVVSGLVEYFSDKVVSEGYLQYQDWLNDNLLSKNPWKGIYRECIIASPCWMCRTNELKSIGGFEDLKYPEDYDLVFKWFNNGYSIEPINEVLLHWREHPDRTSRNSENYAQPSFFNLKTQRFLENEAGSGCIVLWGAGVKARLVASILMEQQIDFRWMDLHPDNYPDGILNKEIEHFKQIESIKNPRLILTVYPPQKEKAELEKYLLQIGLNEGESYWYF